MRSSTSQIVRPIALAMLLVPALFAASGCRTSAQTGSLIGAGAGALGGYMIGNEMEKGGHHHHHR